MTEAQRGLYLREWGKVRKILRGTLSPQAADARRHEIHMEALGSNKSSWLFTNADFDEVLKRFRAISQPANFRTQIDLGAMAAARKRWTIFHLLSALELGEEDAEKLISRRQRAGRLVTASRDAVVTIDTIGEADLSRVMIDLKKKCRSRWPKKEDLLAEIRLVRMSFEFDEMATYSAVTAELKWKTFPGWEKIDYEALLIALSVLRRIAAGKGWPANPDKLEAAPAGEVDEPF